MSTLYKSLFQNNKRLIQRIIFLCLIISCTIKISYAQDLFVEIANDCPITGEELTVTTNCNEVDGITLQWYVAGEKRNTGESYTPKASDYEKFITIKAIDTQGKTVSEDSVFFSKLPVVYINTEDLKEVNSREDYKDASLYIQGNKDYEAQYNGDIKIKGRGTSSWHYDKKPYRIKLDEKSNLFNFGDSKNYVLLANYLDISMLRNIVGYRLSDAMGLCATDSIWVDVVFNGKYRGCYQLCEHVRVGKQLVDVFDWEDYASNVAEWINEDDEDLEDELTNDLSWISTGIINYHGKAIDLSSYEGYSDNINGGYLFELDSEGDKEISNFQTNNGIKVCVSKPEYVLTNDEMFQYVKDLFQDIEDSLCSENGYNNKNQHYTELVDFDSMLNYWLCMEILSNEDAAERSRFCSIDVDGKMAFGPVWDFDISSQSYRSYYGAKGWNVTGTINGYYEKQDFWKELIDDPYFQIKARERYWEIRPILEELIKDDGIIDYYENYLYEAGCSNEILWSGKNYLKRSFTGEAGDVAIYKKFLQKRIEWLDSVFESEDSTTKSLHMQLSENPYKRSKRISLDIINGELGNNEHGAEYTFDSKQSVKLDISKPENSEIKVYVNGILCTDAEIKNNSAVVSYVIPSSYFTENSGYSNVINVIAKVNNRSIQNYVTVSFGKKETIDSDKIISSSFLVKSDYGAKTNCKHSMTHIDAVEASDDYYGIDECWYCNKCQHYYKDEYGTEAVAAKHIIHSNSTLSTAGGIPLTVREIAIILVILVLGIIVSCILLIRKKCTKKCSL